MVRCLYSTDLRTIKNVDISIPNASVLGRQIINYSSSADQRGLILHTAVTIGYDVPWRKVHQLLIEAAQATKNVLNDPKPFVLQTALDDFYARYELNAYTDRPLVSAQTYSDLHQNIQDKLHEGGVEILSPHYAAIRDGNGAALALERRGRRRRRDTRQRQTVRAQQCASDRSGLHALGVDRRAGRK